MLAPPIALLLALQQPAAPPAKPNAAESAAVPTVTAVRAARAPSIDGQLDEPAWGAAPAVTTFRQANPKEGEPGSERTEVRVVYDDAAVYIGARMYERDGAAIRATLTRRDAGSASDVFTVALDSYHDHRTAMVFTVNPLGVRSDYLASSDQGYGDDSWDPVWKAATHVDAGGWTAELWIPLSQLRFPPRAEQIWGVNFFRSLTTRNESDAFVLVRQNEQGFASRFAHLVGVRGVPSPKRLELLPYARSQLESRRPAPGDPFFNGLADNHSVGLDLKYGLTSNLTLDATGNPDFGQVEADPAQLNLTVFESFFQERRPFFVEGAQIFEFGGSGGFSLSPGQVFYSRRIGRAPTLFPDLARALADGEAVPDSTVGPFSNIPKNSRILGAGKLSGRLARGISIGILHAETGRVFGDVYAEQLFGQRTAGELVVERRTRVHYRDEIEPRAHYSVGRVQQDFRGGQTTVGLIYTGVRRDLRTPHLDSLFRRDAHAAGIDWQHRWLHNRFAFTGNAVWTLVRGSPNVITAAQQSSARYFQRPDQTYLRLDPTRTSLAGRTATAKLRYDGPSGWGGSLGAAATSPGYELNDLGFLTEADNRMLFASAGWGTPKPTKRFRRIATEAVMFANWNNGGERTGISANVNFVGFLQNNWGGFLGVGASGTGISATATRGGPAILSTSSRSVNLSVFSDERRPVSGEVFGFVYRKTSGTRAAAANLFVRWRPAHNVQVSVGPSYDVGREMGYLVTTVPDTLAVATYGARYVFGALDQRTLSIRTRASVTFTPALSFQLYAEPFTSAAEVFDFRELRRPRAWDFSYYARDPNATVTRKSSGDYEVDLRRAAAEALQFTIPNPDARFRSFRGSAVLRWEYRPGAALFAVWTHNRGDYEPGGRFGGLSDIRSLFGLPPENVFLLKANYWFSR